MIAFDPEHILAMLMFLAPMDEPRTLALEADVIAEVSSSPSDASMLMVLATVSAPDAWGSRAEARCRSSQEVTVCSRLMLQRWEESRYCATIEGRFSYWNHGDCVHRDRLTRRQARGYRAMLLEME